MKSRMNWKRGLLRLWLLAAIPWVVYAVGEFDVAEKAGYARLYYTDRQVLIDELRSPAAVAECVAADLARGAKYDRLIDDNSDLIERYRREDAAAKGLPASREMGIDSILAAEKLPQLQEERDQAYWDELVKTSPVTARLREVSAACSSRIPEAPDLRWIIPVLIAPTFGVAFAAFAIWLTFLTLRWAWRGFQS